MHRAALSFTLLAAAVGCREQPSSAPAPTASASSAKAPLEPSASGPAPPAADSARPLPAPIDQKAYQAALAEGRNETRARRHDKAIAAFDRALATWPLEPRTLAERGYEKLLADDLDGAAADLDLARKLGPDAGLSAQIWFNLGLLAEKRGDDAAARAAFARSNVLSPSRAAQAKLAARDTCGTAIEKGRKVDPEDTFQPRLLTAATWLDAFQKLYGGRDAKGDPPPRSDDEAKQSLCVRFGVDRCGGPPPWVLSRFENTAFGEYEDHLFPMPSGLLLIYHAGLVARETEITRRNEITCVSQSTLRVDFGPTLVHVSIATALRQWKDAEVATRERCTVAHVEVEDTLYDVPTQRELLRVTREGGLGMAKVHVVGRTAEIAAGTCKVTIPLDAAAGDAGRP